jgi:hypothetical protein
MDGAALVAPGAYEKDGLHGGAMLVAATSPGHDLTERLDE